MTVSLLQMIKTTALVGSASTDGKANGAQARMMVK
jgi:hypothetical protein